jgi:signal transduction histidine kinase
MDEKKNLWIGTKGGGLNYFDRQQEKFYHYTTTDGLTDNVVYCIVPDNAGNIWLTTNRGISRFNITAKTFTNFSRRDGLLNSEFNRQGGIYQPDGNIYLSGTSGVDYFNPAKIISPETPSAVSFSEIKLNGNRVIPARNNILNYSQNSFFFSFTANDFIRPDLVNFRYRISNKDNWTLVRGINTALYSALSPGDYDFEVQASYDNLNWSESTYYSFTIKQPWWQTTWFIVSAALLVISVLWLLYRYRISQLKKVHRLRSKISQDLHDEVGATLSSIHVYSSVAAKAMDKDTGKAIDAFENINSNARQVMENMSDIVWAINTGDVKETTLEGKLKNYGYDLLTPLNIKCEYRIDKEAEKKLVNMEARKNILLIAKEAMNNISKHSSATEASVQLKVTGKYLQLEITDNGRVANEKQKAAGNGMLNMRRRAEEMGGSVSFVSEKEKGSQLTCRVPLTTISD